MKLYSSEHENDAPSKSGDELFDFEMNFPELERAFPESIADTTEPTLKQRFKKSADKYDHENLLANITNNNIEIDGQERSSMSKPYGSYLIEFVQCASALAAVIILWKTCF